MRLRNKPPSIESNARSNTAGATDKGKRKAATASAPPSQPEEEELEIGMDEKLPALKFDDLRPDEDDEDEVVLQTLGEEEPAFPVESTPFATRRQRKAVPPIPHVPSKTPIKQPFSPLPPSSPPSVFSDELEYENAPPLPGPALITPPDEEELDKENYFEQGNKENRFFEDEDDAPIPAPQFEILEPVGRQKSSSSDDPFGFSALERRLKAKRESKRRSGFDPVPVPHPIRNNKGKEPMRPRAPLGELSVDPVASTSIVKDRAPTPYHPSDDLEDMYADPNELPESAPIIVAPPDDYDENANMSPPTGLEGLEAEMDDEEAAELVCEETRREKGKSKALPVDPSSEASEMVDPLRTPQPQHVANIYPLRSPFSSREGTPCDRSLMDSPPSSPSPMKPLTVVHPFPVSTAKKSTRKRIFPSAAKARPKPQLEPPAAKRRRVTLGKENDVVDHEPSEDPSLQAGKKPPLAVRRSGRLNTAASPSSVTSKTLADPVVKRGRGRPPASGTVLVPDSTSIVEETSDLESADESPVVTRKRKAAVIRPSPAKRSKTQARPSTRAAPAKPPSKRAKPPSGAQTRGKAAAKGKGKGKASADILEDENSVRLRSLCMLASGPDLIVCNRTKLERGRHESSTSSS